MPIKVVNTTKRKHPWFTLEHHNMIKERDRLYQRLDSTRHRAELMYYSAMRVSTHQCLDNTRLYYYANILCVISDSKELCLHYIFSTSLRVASFSDIWECR